MTCGACSTNGGNRNEIQGFGGEPEGKGHLEDLGLDERIILRRILQKEDGRFLD